MLKTIFQQFPRYFFLLFVVFFLTSLIVLFELFRSYRAEAELFVSSKSPAISAESVAATLARVPLTLSFYDRLLVDHSNISDPWIGKESVSRKNSWLQIASSERYPETSIIHFSMVGDRSTETKALLDASLETLYGFSGRLYDREHEADIRLFEETIVQPFVRSPWTLFVFSGSIALILSFATSVFFGKVFEKIVFHRPRVKGTDHATVFETCNQTAKPAFDRPSVLFPVPSFSDFQKKPISSSADQTVSPIVFERPKENVFGKMKTMFEKPEELKETTSASALNTQKYSQLFEEKTKKTVEKKEESIESRKQIHYDYNRIIPIGVKKETPMVPAPTFVLKQTDPGMEGERITPLQKENISSEKKESEMDKDEKETETLKSSNIDRQSNVVPAGGFPGNLETIPARDFSWEKYLFQGNGAELIEDVDEKNDEAEKSDVFEKREPTPEELKARLNQLLRGEI